MPDADALRPAEGRGPIFIIGAMGSGTTLLRLMLDSHERIAIPHETGFMRAYKSVKFIPFKWTGRHWATRLGWSAEDMDAELGRFFDRIFMRYADEHGAARWGEKTPLHTWHISAMARVFPDAVFVGIVRHPGASIASNMTRFRRPMGKALVHHERYNHEIARQAAAHADRFVLFRYEDLVLNTEPVMRELLEWLGEPWSDSVLEHHVVQGSRSMGAHDRTEGKTRADDAIDVSRVHKWRDTMPRAQQRQVARRLTRIGELFGYSMSEPERLAPLHDRDALLFTGDDLRARFGDFEDLDFSTRRAPPRAEQYYSPKHYRLAEADAAGPPRLQPQPPAPPAWRRAAIAAVRALPAPVRRRLVGSVRGVRRTRQRRRKAAAG